MIIGNGGSAAEAQHLAAEFLGTYGGRQTPLPAIALTTDTSTITAIANDLGFKEIFARQLIALGKPGDILIGMSTSGESENINYAYEWAEKMDIEVIDFPRDGYSVAEIQNKHLELIHDICSLVGEEFE